MSLITLNAVDYSVGGPLLLERVDLAIEAGERIALIGRNGAGKSTLLRLLAGELKPDDGEVRREGGVRVARLEQEVPADARRQRVRRGRQRPGRRRRWRWREYHHLIHAEPVDMDALAAVQAQDRGRRTAGRWTSASPRPWTGWTWMATPISRACPAA